MCRRTVVPSGDDRICTRLQKLVGEPQAAASRVGRVGALASGERPVDVPGVADLAHEGLVLAPDSQPALTAGVTHTVRGNLIRGQREIAGAARVEGRRRRDVADQPADQPEPICIKRRLPRRRGRRGYSTGWLRRASETTEASSVVVSYGHTSHHGGPESNARLRSDSCRWHSISSASGGRPRSAHRRRARDRRCGGCDPQTRARRE